MFRKGKAEQRVCKVFDAPNLPEAEARSFPVLLFIKNIRVAVGIYCNVDLDIPLALTHPITNV
ncbi:hypothetical protein RJ639_028973 [Escallonia herrerae]|uniref:Rad51-like C-terminal domain-containing protein n=1 Tax=Escallonia herrerae TaxID=1293975 RepID=A0AA88X5X9_9ASTE|nr:hypothetical protein RJ639_028973 [Escallonia herrerae]